MKIPKVVKRTRHVLMFFIGVSLGFTGIGVLRVNRQALNWDLYWGEALREVDLISAQRTLVSVNVHSQLLLTILGSHIASTQIFLMPID